MRIFVTEYLCSGAWPEASIPSSLQREGRAMLEGVVDDLARIPEVQVLTTWDVRLGEPPFRHMPGIQARPVSSPEQEQAEFQDLARRSDVTLVIAPELDGILLKRCTWLAAEGIRTANAASAAIELCGDKLALSLWCRQFDVASIPTVADRALATWEISVVKRRDGAGSTGMRLWSNTDPLPPIHHRPPVIFQPYVPGRSLSIAGLFEHGRLRFLLPPADQRISTDGTFRYLGGRIPAMLENPPRGVGSELPLRFQSHTECRTPHRPQHETIERIAEIVEKAAGGIAGLHGYIGFDFLLPHASPGMPLLVEVNPRLTTSYVGYRRVCRENLGRWLIPGRTRTPPEFHGFVEFP